MYEFYMHQAPTMGLKAVDASDPGGGKHLVPALTHPPKKSA
jgi:hypothetical protein